MTHTDVIQPDTISLVGQPHFSTAGVCTIFSGVFTVGSPGLSTMDAIMAHMLREGGIYNIARRAAKQACRPWLAFWYPELLTPPSIDGEDRIHQWLRDQVDNLGETIPIGQIPLRDGAPITPKEYFS